MHTKYLVLLTLLCSSKGVLAFLGYLVGNVPFVLRRVGILICIFRFSTKHP